MRRSEDLSSIKNISIRQMANPSIDKILDGNWYYVPRAAANKEAIKKDLTIEILDHIGNTLYIPLYKEEKYYFKVPRLYGFAQYGLPRFARMATGVDIDPSHLRNVRFALYPAQQQCVNAIQAKYFTKERISSGFAGCVLNLACGKGKTHIGIQRCLDVGKRTIVICHSNVSVTQWITNFKRSLPGLTISEFHGGALFPQTDVVIATIHPLSLDRSIARYDKTLFEDWLATFGQVIYDEIHIFGASKFSAIFDKVLPAVQLGLSATPERSDGMEKVFELKVGPILDAQKDLGITPPSFDVTVYPLTPPTPPKLAASAERRNGAYATMIKTLTLSEFRMDFLIEKMKAHFARIPNDNFLIFCNYIEEVEFVYQHLIQIFPALYIDRVYGDVCAEAIAMMADTARILICTYKKGGTAFSPLRFRALIVWSPTRAMITQAVGRIQRWRDEEGIELGPEGSWNALPRTIYDIIDQNTASSGQYYSDSNENGHVILSRHKAYLNAGYRVFKPREAGTMTNMAEETAALFSSVGFS
jgi:hypothetical protein